MKHIYCILLVVFFFLLNWHTAQAQVIAELSFRAEVTEIDDRHEVMEADVEIGDIITGSVIYTVESEPFQEDIPGKDAFYVLDDGLSKMFIDVNDLHAETDLTDLGTPNKRRMEIRMKQIKWERDEGDSCMNEIRFQSQSNLFSDTAKTTNSHLYIRLYGFGCDFGFDTQQLPLSITQEHWTVTYLLIWRTIESEFPSSYTIESDSIEFDLVVTSIEDQPNPSEVLVFPNPARDVLSVHYNETHSASLSLHSVLGETLLRTNASGTNAQLNIESIPAGSYYLIIENQGRLAMQSLVIQR